MESLQTLEMQHLFMTRVIESIQVRGLESVPPEDVKKLRALVSARKEQLTQLQATEDLEFLLKLKNKMYRSDADRQA